MPPPAQCCNNLKQIGLALHNYSDASGHLPPGNEVAAPGAMSPIRSNWAINLLPFLEMRSLYNDYKIGRSNTDSANELVRKTFVKVYTCPADPVPHLRRIRFLGRDRMNFT